jgi:error-prone DNA polymerase
MVICQGQLDQVVPLERASMPGRTVIQWDKEDCADMHIIKVDLLGLGMMAVLADCLDLVPEFYGDRIDLAQLPEDDDVYRTIQRADTIGMFQIESRAQMASLPKHRPRKRYCITKQVALIRPGPIHGDMTHPYLERRMGRQPVTYPHPSLKPVLERTLGVPLFQEQLLKMAMIAGNFSGADADELRRAVGMKRSWERMKNLEGKLRAGMTENGIDAKSQDQIVKNISSFALYGFPESHAASFGELAYDSAYIKVKYPEAFLCAILNNQPMGFYSAATLVKDAQRHGVHVRPIDVQISDWQCTIEREEHEKLSVRLGLGYVKNLTKRSAEALVAAREADGPFVSADDLTQRVPSLTRQELARLAGVGALNSLDGIEHRRDAIWQVERAGKLEGPLFRQNSDVLCDHDASLPLRQMSTEERLVADYAGTSLTIGKHPMAYRRQALRKQNVLSSNDLQNRRHGEFVLIAGCVAARQRPGTANGITFMSLEDEGGLANLIIMVDVYEKNQSTVVRSKFILAGGVLQVQDDVIHVKVAWLRPLSDQALEVHSHDFH